MVPGGMGCFWTSIALLAAVSAGPLHRYPRESEDYQNDLSMYANYTANEVCFSEGEVFQKGDMMPNPGPCEECRCEPPSIVCNMIKCPVNNNGCRTIQRPNHCCPDYNCECDYNGQLYNDGERLDLPEEPCQVCYCKGGEVMCNSITCYHRDDCNPIQVPGQCCPKYENCPVRDMGSSSSDEKNVLVKSTNKTNHVPPKREMNPWLLTKLPPASSSAPPKPSQYPTTEGENIIIVSDWLTERRTTTEDASRSDEEKQNDPNIVPTGVPNPNLFTDSDRLTTVIKQDVSSDKGMVVKNSEVITPIDEVIFTRIDGSKDNHEINVESPASISSKDSENKFTTFIPSSTISPQNKENKTNIITTQTPLHSTLKNEDLKKPNSHLNLTEKEMVSEISTIEPTNTEKLTNPMKFEVNANVKNNMPTESPIYPNGLNNTLQPDEISSDSPTTPLYIDLTKETKTINAPKDITLEHIFGIDGLTIGGIEPDTTEKDIFGSYTTEKEETFTDINEFTGNSLEVQNKVEPKSGELKVVNEDKTTIDGFSDTTTNSLIDIDDTTPLFTEVNERKGNIESDNIKKENALQEISENYQTELPKLKEQTVPETSVSEVTNSPNVDQKVDTTSDTILNSETETNRGLNQSHSTNSIKIKRKNNNSSGKQTESELSVEGPIAPLSNSVSEIPEVTQQTIIVSEGTTRFQNQNTNDPTSVQINVDAPMTKLSSDYPSPTVINSRGDESDDSKEVMSDAPPVLELNSHVPFLQLGGHGNFDPDMITLGGNHQTKPTDENREIVNEKEKELIENIPVFNSSLNSSGNYSVMETQVNITKIGENPNLSIYNKNNQSTTQETQKEFTAKNQIETETTTDAMFTSTHIPLTPGDLKVLAEYLINDTIKTVTVKNVTDYTPNQWLKGNLTSEEKIASIMSAANISIAIMNSTDDLDKKPTAETTKSVSEPTRVDKFEKDKSLSGKSVFNNVKISNKTSFIQGKRDEYLDSPKINSEPEIPLNDEGKLVDAGVKTSTESPKGYDNNNTLVKNVTVNEMTPVKIQVKANDLKNLKNTEGQSSTSETTEIQSISQSADGNNLRFDNVNPAESAGKNQYTQNNLLRNKKLLDDTTTSYTSSISVTTGYPQTQGTL